MKRFIGIVFLFLMILVNFPIFADSFMELQDLWEPGKMVIHNSCLYVTDGFGIKIFNLSDGKAITSFGRRGKVQ